MHLERAATDGTGVTMENEDFNMERDVIPMYDPTPLGWRCPNCSKGLAPHVTVCPCVPITTSDELRWRWDDLKQMYIFGYGVPEEAHDDAIEGTSPVDSYNLNKPRRVVRKFTVMRQKKDEFTVGDFGINEKTGEQYHDTNNG